MREQKREERQVSKPSTHCVTVTVVRFSGGCNFTSSHIHLRGKRLSHIPLGLHLSPLHPYKVPGTIHTAAAITVRCLGPCHIYGSLSCCKVPCIVPYAWLPRQLYSCKEPWTECHTYSSHGVHICCVNRQMNRLRMKRLLGTHIHGHLGSDPCNCLLPPFLPHPSTQTSTRLNGLPGNNCAVP